MWQERKCIKAINRQQGCHVALDKKSHKSTVGVRHNQIGRSAYTMIVDLSTTFLEYLPHYLKKCKVPTINCCSSPGLCLSFPLPFFSISDSSHEAGLSRTATTKSRTSGTVLLLIGGCSTRCHSSDVTEKKKLRKVKTSRRGCSRGGRIPMTSKLTKFVLQKIAVRRVKWWDREKLVSVW